MKDVRLTSNETVRSLFHDLGEIPFSQQKKQVSWPFLDIDNHRCYSTYSIHYASEDFDRIHLKSSIPLSKVSHQLHQPFLDIVNKTGFVVRIPPTTLIKKPTKAILYLLGEILHMSATLMR